MLGKLGPAREQPLLSFSGPSAKSANPAPCQGLTCPVSSLSLEIPAAHGYYSLLFATLVLGTPKHCAEDDPEQDGGQEAAADKWKLNVDNLPSGFVYPSSQAAGTSSRTTPDTGYCWCFTGT